MTSNTYQEIVVSHELANLFRTRQEIHITKKVMQISDVCSTSKVSTGKKKWAKKEDKTFNQALLALPTYYYPRQGYLLCLDSL
jgi:hypothetical protein